MGGGQVIPCFSHELQPVFLVPLEVGFSKDPGQPENAPNHTVADRKPLRKPASRWPDFG